jgi:MFS transporter, DHA2 family, multidrug resistance protein
MQPQANRWAIVATAAVAIFMVMLDTSITNVSLPSIAHHFAVRPGVAQWAALSYLLTTTAVVLPFGRWLDRVGQRPALLLGVSGFGLASAASACAPSLGVLVGVRVLQGMFGALILALVPAIVLGAVGAGERGRAVGVIATLGPLGSVSGPALGGLLTQSLGWRAIFLVNLPVSLVLVLVISAVMPAGRRLVWPDRAWFAQAALLAGAILALMLALTQAARSGDARWLLLLAPAVVLLLAWSRDPRSRPIVAMLSRREVATGLGALVLLASATTGMQFLLPFFQERLLSQTPATTGLTMLAYPASMMLVGLAAGTLTDRWGARRLTLAGATILTVAVGLILPLASTWHPVDLVWRLAIAGIGMGLFNGPNGTAVMTSVAPEDRGAASGASGLARSLAFATGPVLASTLWTLSGYHLSGMRAGLGLALALSLGALLLSASAWLPRRFDQPVTVRA